MIVNDHLRLLVLLLSAAIFTGGLIWAMVMGIRDTSGND